MRRFSYGRIQSVGVGLWAILLVVSTAMGDPSAPAPDALFDVAKLSLPADKRSELATSMGTFVRNHLDLTNAAATKEAGKFLSVALTLDPQNKVSFVANALLAQGRLPGKVSSDLDGAGLSKQLLALANEAKVGNASDDRLLAAYLYSLMLEIQPDQDDAVFEMGILQSAGVKPIWAQGPAAVVVDKGLVIRSARYGEGSHWLDVTQVLQSQIRDELIPAPHDLPDPSPGVHKVLTMEGTFGGKEFVLTMPENGTSQNFIFGTPKADPNAPARVPRRAANGQAPAFSNEAVDTDAIERPAYKTNPKSFAIVQASIKSMMVRVEDDGQMVGSAIDLIATLSPDSRRRGAGEARFVGGRTGNDMESSLNETMRAIRLRYPEWEGGTVDLSFGDQYDKHDGGSAGTALGMLLLSLLEGTTLDPAVAVTGDMTVDWKVRKIGGVAAKIRGAQLDKCSCAIIPAANADDISNIALLYDQSLIWDVQILSMSTLQEAMKIARSDRDAKYVEAMHLFDDLRAKHASGKFLTASPEIRTGLEKIIMLAPNHLSAQYLLQVSRGLAPRTLSPTASLYQFFTVAYSYRDLLYGGGGINRGSLPAATLIAARKRIAQLHAIADPKIQPVLVDFSAFIEACDRVSSGRTDENDLNKYRQAIVARLQGLQADRPMMEKLVRDGF